MESSSTTTHMPYCTGHDGGGDLCRSKSWTVAGVRLGLFGHETDVPPTAVQVDAGTYRCAYTPAEASQLSEALTALGMLAHHVDPQSVAYWTGRLDWLETQDDRLATS